MKTLQELLRTTTIHKIYAAASRREVTDEAVTFYANMTDRDDVVADQAHVLFAAAYVSWDPTNRTPDFTASAYDIEKNKSMGIMFVPRNELLGYLVSDMSIALYGKEVVLNAILEGTTFFGYDEQAATDERDSLLAAANEIEEGDPAPLSELLDEMGIDPKLFLQTPEEEAFTSRALEKNAAIRDNQIAAILAQLAQ